MLKMNNNAMPKMFQNLLFLELPMCVHYGYLPSTVQDDAENSVGRKSGC